MTMHCEHQSGIFVIGNSEQEVQEAGEKVREALDGFVEKFDAWLRWKPEVVNLRPDRW